MNVPDVVDFDLRHPDGPLVTLSSASEGRGRFLRRSAGHGRFGSFRVRLAPHPGPSAYRFSWSTFFQFPAYAKNGALNGVKRALAEPRPSGEIVVLVHVEIVDCQYHEHDSDEQTMATAAWMAVTDALSHAQLVER